MRLLFVHQNFPGQYRHLACYFGSRPGHEVLAVGEKSNILRQRPQLPGVKLLGYDMPQADRDGWKQAIARARVVAAGAAKLRAAGFKPDVIFTHLGWGEGLFLKDIFPEARILLYCEFFYRARGADSGFDPEFAPGPQSPLRLRLMNAPLLMALDASDWGIAPTRWQERQFPAAYRSRITVIHDGIDTDVVKPAPNAGDDELITYTARNLEPYRGFHIFMRAIPEIQRRRPKARIVILGGDEVSYSPRLPAGETYRERLRRELGEKVDWSRVHMPGRLPYEQYLALLRASSVHVYLTYPFVLSWSLLEAMSAGCLVVASRTPPVEEVITDGENGLLVDFFSPDQIAARIDQALRAGAAMQPIRNRARETICQRYDLKRVCLPAQVQLVAALASGSLVSEPRRVA